jgi:hypothetical protein
MAMLRCNVNRMMADLRRWRFEATLILETDLRSPRRRYQVLACVIGTGAARSNHLQKWHDLQGLYPAWV